MADRARARRIAAVTFAVGAVAIAATAAAVFTEAPPRLLGVSSPGVKAVGATGAHVIGFTRHDLTACQGGETLPAGATAVRVSIWAFYGAEVHVTAYEGARPVMQGSRGPDWTSDSVTVAVNPLRHAVHNVKLCLTIGPNSEPMTLIGAPTSPREAAAIVPSGTPIAAASQAGRGSPAGGGRRLASDGGAAPGAGSEGGAAPRTAEDHLRHLKGRLVFEYLAPGTGSWWSRALPVARRLGLGRAFSGSWIALLIAALMAGVAVLAALVTIRELR